MAKKLSNYLRTHRKRSRLSQAEIAYLLGCRDGAKVSRYERKVREPGLRTILALELVFGIPARELFAGIYDEVKETAVRRAKILLKQLEISGPGCLREVKKEEVLKRIQEADDNQPPDIK